MVSITIPTIPTIRSKPKATPLNDDSFDSATMASSTISSSARRESDESNPQRVKTPTFKRAISTTYTRQTYYEIVKHMKEQVVVKDRTYRLKTYKDCFLAQDVVTVAQEYLKLETREEALQVCKEMNDKIHCWEHVCDDHQIQDAYLFFRFTQDSIRQTGCLAEVMRSRRQAKESLESSLSLIDDDDEDSDSEDNNQHSEHDFSKLEGAFRRVGTDPDPQTRSSLTLGVDQTEKERPTRSLSPKQRKPKGKEPREKGSTGRKTREMKSKRRAAGKKEAKENPLSSSTKTKQTERVPRRERNGSQDSRKGRKARSNSPKRSGDNSRRSANTRTGKDDVNGNDSFRRSSTVAAPRQSSDSRNNNNTAATTKDEATTKGNDSFRRSSTFAGRGSRRHAHLSPVAAGVSQSRRYQGLKKKQDSLQNLFAKNGNESDSEDEEDQNRTYLPATASPQQQQQGARARRGFERAASFKAKPSTSLRQPAGSALPPKSSSGPPRLASIEKAKEAVKMQKRQTITASAVSAAVQW